MDKETFVKLFTEEYIVNEDLVWTIESASVYLEVASIDIAKGFYITDCIVKLENGFYKVQTKRTYDDLELVSDAVLVVPKVVKKVVYEPKKARP